MVSTPPEDSDEFTSLPTSIQIEEILRKRSAEKVSEGLDDALTSLTDALSGTSEGLSRAAVVIKRLNQDLERYKGIAARLVYLHAKRDTSGVDYCTHCSQLCGKAIMYPCPTVRVLRGEAVERG